MDAFEAMSFWLIKVNLFRFSQLINQLKKFYPYKSMTCIG